MNVFDRVVRWLSGGRREAVHKAVALLIAVLAIVRPSSAQVLVRSDFDADAQGWTVATFASICGTLSSAQTTGLTWTAAGGAPGGFIRTTDPSGSRTSLWRAPAAYRGDKSALLGGAIRFEHRLNVSPTADAIYNASDDVYLIGGGLTLISNAPNVSRDAWGQVEVPLRPGYWRVGSCSGPQATEADLLTALSSVTNWYIRAEYHNGGESNDLDSVELDATQTPVGCPASWEEIDDSEPSGRWRHAVAVDPVRQVLVMFGGDTGEADTWEWSLTTKQWTRIVTPVSPTRRGGHAMAYDPVRGVIVMTGGGYLGRLAEVWHYDAAANTWTAATPLPLARSGHAMTYDTVRNVMVLYGGADDTTADGLAVMERGAGSETWTARASAVNPGEQYGLSLAYDPARQRTVAVSRGTTAIRVDEWDGVAGTWELRAFTGSSPGARDNPVIVYDPVRSRIVLMGGDGNNSTWDYDGTSWTARANILGGGRDEHAGVYDPVNQRVLLSGGIRGNHTPRRDLLAFDGTANQWSTVWERSDCGARELFGIIYDEIGQRPIVYGGALRQRVTIVQQTDNRTYAFGDGVWTAATVTGDPGARRQHAPIYDPTRRVMMVYGGANSYTQASANGRLWELNLATMAWSDRGPQAPGQRFDLAAVFMRERNELVVHGGLNELGQRLGDTWIYRPATALWTTLPTGDLQPPARNGAGYALDERRGVMVLFGGRLGTDGRYDNSTWEWNGTSWRNATPPSGNPPARTRARLIYDPQRGTVVMLAGIMNGNSGSDPVIVGTCYTDLWEWNGAAWRRIEQQPGPRPTAMASGGTIYDRADGNIVHFGGTSVTNEAYRNGQTWRLHLPPPGCGAACRVDLNGDGIVDFGDYLEFLNRYEAQDLSVDFTEDGFIDFSDYLEFLNLYEAGC